MWSQIEEDLATEANTRNAETDGRRASLLDEPAQAKEVLGPRAKPADKGPPSGQRTHAAGECTQALATERGRGTVAT
eukprot:4237783-Pyramimonas_sp.AAC.1